MVYLTNIIVSKTKAVSTFYFKKKIINKKQKKVTFYI